MRFKSPNPLRSPKMPKFKGKQHFANLPFKSYISAYGLKPHILGVYLLFDEDELIYVGKSTDVRKRVMHQHQKKNYTSWSYIKCKDMLEASLLEIYYIYKYTPCLNKKLW